jgi:hypothetical protein
MLQDDNDAHVTALEVAATNLGTWCPKVEALVDDLRMEVQRLAQGRDPKVFDALPHWLSVAAS